MTNGETLDFCTCTSKGLVGITDVDYTSLNVIHRFRSFLFFILLLNDVILYVAMVIAMVLVGIQEHRGRNEHQWKHCMCSPKATWCKLPPLSLGKCSFIILQLSTIVMAMLLLLAGDVERNPGPLTSPLTDQSRLYEEDIGPLVEILAHYASKWRDIGSYLGFIVAELDTIAASPPGQKDTEYLRSMLNQWVHWTPESSHRKYAMLEDLKKALRSDVVNLGSVADELLPNLQPFYMQQERSQEGDIVTLHYSTAFLQFAMYLKGVYKRTLASSDKFPRLTCSKFINLVLVKKEIIDRLEADKFTKATLHGHIDEILKKKEPIKLEEVLNPPEGQPDMKCIFLEGSPGIGKSTCVGELCRRWDEIVALKMYSLVILVRLREKRVQEAQSVEDLCYHRNIELRQAVAAEIEACEGRGVLFVLDGFDELPASLRRESMFVELIQGSYLSHCTVLVTSRPSATADFLSVAQSQIHKQVEVVGFTQENIKEYARAIFYSKPDMLDDFLKYISTNPVIRSMMYIPMNSAIVVEIYRYSRTASRPIPKTMTQLYSEMSLTLIKRHLGKDDPLVKQLPQRLEDLPLQLYQPFRALAKLAFEGMERNEVIFNNLPDGFVHFGFMNSPTELYMGEKVSTSCSFLHLTLQEFLAAFHISQLPPSEQKSIMLDKYFKTAEQGLLQKRDSYDVMEMTQSGGQWDVVLRFVAGLTGLLAIESELENDDVLLFLIQCLYEAQDKVDCNLFFEKSEVGFKSRADRIAFLTPLNLTALDIYTVGYCIASTKCDWKLDMSDTSLGGTLVEMLKHGLCSPNKSPPQTAEYGNIVAVNLSSCNLNSEAMDQLADIIVLMTNLRELNIYDNPAGEGGLVKLFHALSHLKSLQELDIRNTKIGCQDAVALSHIVSPSSSLKKLVINIGDTHAKSRVGVSLSNKVMSAECEELILKTVLSPSSLESVDLPSVNWNDEAITLLGENSNLTEISQTFDIDPEGIKSTKAIAKALLTNSCIKKLQFICSSGNDPFSVGDIEFPSDVASSLSEMIKCNQTLETLKIFACSVTEAHLLSLSNALKYNHTLKQVKLGMYRPLIKLDPRICF